MHKDVRVHINFAFIEVRVSQLAQELEGVVL